MQTPIVSCAHIAPLFAASTVIEKGTIADDPALNDLSVVNMKTMRAIMVTEMGISGQVTECAFTTTVTWDTDTATTSGWVTRVGSQHQAHITLQPTVFTTIGTATLNQSTHVARTGVLSLVPAASLNYTSSTVAAAIGSIVVSAPHAATGMTLCTWDSSMMITISAYTTMTMVASDVVTFSAVSIPFLII